MKKTKIVATIGPASESVRMLRTMIKEGMNVCRLNFSHGDYVWHKKAIAKIRKAASLEKKNVAIMADIQGPRIRVANRENVVLRKGDLIFVTDDTSLYIHKYKKELLLDWKHFYVYVKKGDRIFIEDGIIDLEVVARKKGGCVAKVLQEGVVKPKKGVNIPSISSHMDFLTDKDLRDLEFILSQEVEYVAVSFVGSQYDLVALKGLMNKWKEKIDHQRKIKLATKRKGKLLSKEVLAGLGVKLPMIVSKIERKDAIVNIDEIIEETDAVMVARGDLAIEMPQQKVALLQKDLIKRCLKAKKPVIVATQMMHTMIENPRPTRAEISDVTNAVIDHADAVMLSGESAQGKFPDRVIKTMAEIIMETEKSPYDDVVLKLVNKFARLIYRVKKKKNSKLVRAKNLEEAIAFAVLRQEDIRIKIATKNVQEKLQGALIWGVD